MCLISSFAPEYSSQVERTGWILVLWGMLTQISNFGFPSYNVVLGFWGAYCAFSKHGRATFGSVASLVALLVPSLILCRYICFLFLSIFLDIIFASLYGSEGRGPTFNFALTMLIFALFTKASPTLPPLAHVKQLAALYSSSHFFSAIGGAHSMESSLGQSAYDAMGPSLPPSVCLTFLRSVQWRLGLPPRHPLPIQPAWSGLVSAATEDTALPTITQRPPVL
jgi:hypothetical protein